MASINLVVTPEEHNLLESSSVREYCITEYGNDELCFDIDDMITFSDVLDALNHGEDIYEVIGVGDSMIREYVFAGLADLLNLDYDVIYKLWIGN